MSDELPITFSLGTDVGKVREHNEDWVAVEDPPDPQARAKGRLFIVADGMGGYQAGEVASRLAAETVRREYYADPSEDPTVRLRNAVQVANGEVYRSAHSDQARAGMGTTVVAAVAIGGRKAYIASVGDSRAYVIHKGALSQITQDHSFVGEQIRVGLLTKEQARVHPQRNIITRALGSQPTVQVDTFEGELSEGDALILCTDGLTSHVPEDLIRDTVMQLPPDQAVPRLIQMARDDGGTDNISTIVLRVGSPVSVQTVAAPKPVARAETTVSAQPAARPSATRKSALSLAWVAAGVVLVLMGVAVVGVVALSMTGILQIGGWINPKPTQTVPVATTALVATAPVATRVPSNAPTSTLPATDAPTSTLIPTPLPTLTRTPVPATRILPTLLAVPTVTVVGTPGTPEGFITPPPPATDKPEKEKQPEPQPKATR